MSRESTNHIHLDLPGQRILAAGLSGQYAKNPTSDSIQFGPGRPAAIPRPKPQTRPITRVAWKHVEMDMKHLLTGSRTICQVEVCTFASEPAVSQGSSNALGYAEHVSARFLVELREGSGMIGGDDQHMSWIDRLNIHEGPAKVILEDDT